MSFDGSGNYTRNNGTFTGSSVWANDAAAGTKITSTNHDTHDQDIANALTQCLTKTGVSTPTANLPMGGFKLTGLGNGTALTDSATVGQIQSSGSRFAITGGTSTAYTLTLAPAITAYADGATYTVKFNATNGASATLNINGVGAIALKGDNGALVAGAIVADQYYNVTYSSGGGCFYVMPLALPVMTGGSWSPTYFIEPAGLTFTGTTTNYAKYFRLGAVCFFHIQVTGTVGGVSSSGGLRFTLPFTAVSTSSTFNFPGTIFYAGARTEAYGTLHNTTNGVITPTGSNFGLGANTIVSASGFYEIA